MLSPQAAAAAAAAHVIRKGGGEMRQRIANYAMAAPAGHGLIGLALAQVKQRMQDSAVLGEDYDVLYTTGVCLLMQNPKPLMFCGRT